MHVVGPCSLLFAQEAGRCIYLEEVEYEDCARCIGSGGGAGVLRWGGVVAAVVGLNSACTHSYKTIKE